MKKQGLSDGNRSFLIAAVEFILLIWGPIESLIIFRLFYLVAVPIALWLILKKWGHYLANDSDANDRLTRTLAGITAGALLIGAYLSYSAKAHSECTQWIQTRDGQECVGDYVVVGGGDKVAAMMQIFFAGIAIWIGVSKKEHNLS